MSVLGEANAIIHRVQVEFGVHVNDNLRHFIENMLMQAVQKDSEHNYRYKMEWMNKYLDIEYPDKTY